MWQKKAGHEHDHVDGRTHTHHIHLFNSVTGAEHNIHIQLGLPSCPTCGRAYPTDDIGNLDPKSIVQAEVQALQERHGALLAYAEKHGIAVKVGDLHSVVPDSHKAIQVGAHKMLMPQRKK